MNTKLIKELYNRRAAVEQELLSLAALENEILNTLPDGETQDGIYSALIIKVHKPIISDWDALTKHIRENNMFELLQRRINTTYYNELKNENYEVPGVNELAHYQVCVSRSLKD